MAEALEKLIYTRAVIVATYKRFETIIIYVLKFLCGLYIFSAINGWFATLGLSYAARLDRFSSVMLAAVLTAIIPPTWVFMLMWLFITLHIFYFSLELTLIAGLALLCLIFFYIRIFPKESWLIILLLVCFKLKIPYFVPLVAGLFVGIGSVGAVIIGTMLWYIAPEFRSFGVEGSTLGAINVLSLPQTVADTLKAFIGMLTENDDWIRVALVFVITVIAVHAVAHLPIPYSMEASIGVGFLTLIIGGTSGMPGSFLGFLASAFLSALLALLCKFFYIIVDYDSTERVSFQDDDFLYYVKAVPKIKK